MSLRDPRCDRHKYIETKAGADIVDCSEVRACKVFSGLKVKTLSVPPISAASLMCPTRGINGETSHRVRVAFFRFHVVCWALSSGKAVATATPEIY